MDSYKDVSTGFVCFFSDRVLFHALGHIQHHHGRIHGGEVATAGAPLPLTKRDRTRVDLMLRELLLQEGVTDIVFETHLAGHDDASHEQHHPLEELLDLLDRDLLTAGTRYVTD